MPESWTTGLVAVVGIAVFLYGFSKTAMPVAGVLAGPMLAAALGATTGSAFIVPLMLIADLFALARYREHVNWPLILRLVPGVLLGFVITALMFRFMDVTTLGRIIGVLILTSVLLEVWRRRNPRTDEDPHPNRLSVGFFGTLAGMTTMAANAGGTAMTLYLINMRVSMLAFMGTFAWFFFILNALKVPILAGLGFLDAETLVASIPFVPVVVIGALVGIPVFTRMNERVFTNIALSLSAIAAIWLIVHG
jgi:uncharacterized protein